MENLIQRQTHDNHISCTVPTEFIPSGTKMFTFETSGPILVVSDLSETVVTEQFVGRVREMGDILRRSDVMTVRGWMGLM